MKKKNNIYIKSLLLVVAVVMGVANLWAQEGSGNWTGSQTSRQSYLWVPNMTTGGTGNPGYDHRGFMMLPSDGNYNSSNPYDPGHRLYVYVKNGETVYWGFRRTSGSNRTAQWYYDNRSHDGTETGSLGLFPAGTTGQGRRTIGLSATISTTSGPDQTQSTRGPNITGVRSNGYNANSFTNNTGQDRAFWIELNSNNSGNQISFWDVSVYDGTTHKPGRVYSKYWSVYNGLPNIAGQISTNNNNLAFHDNFGFYVPVENTNDAAKEGYYVKQILFPGANTGYGVFFANEDGPSKDLTFENNRKSIAGTSSNYHYPLFVAQPDNSIWGIADEPFVEVIPVFSPRTLQEETAFGGPGGKAVFTVTVDNPGFVDILIDLDGNGYYNDGDVIISSELPYNESLGGKQTFEVVWNGNDDDGNAVASGKEVTFVSMTTFFPVHFPIYDLEQSLGMKVNHIAPSPHQENQVLFWDHSNLRPYNGTPNNSPQFGNTTSTAINQSDVVWVNVTGMSGMANQWWATGNNGIGDVRTMNFWAGGAAETLTEKYKFYWDASDLQIEKSVDNTSPNVGDVAVFTINVYNYGLQDAEHVVVVDQLPDGLTYVSHDNYGVGTVTIDHDNNKITWTVGDMPYLSPVEDNGLTLTVRALVNGSGPYNNKVTVESDGSDADPDNNESGVTLTPKFCTTGCNDNTFLNAIDPNTIEYDNIVGLYHSTLIKEVDGTVKVWGARSGPTGSSPSSAINTSPVAVTPANGYNYTGEILKITGGASNGSDVQFGVLTTDGLYVWGNQGLLINPSLTSSDAFQKVTNVGTYGESGTSVYGLPMGVEPENVKMLFGTYRTLAITTCTGEAWVMAYDAPMFGDGVTSTSGTNRYVWHRVSTADNTPLENVVAVRGTGPSLMALTSDGKVYVWGSRTYLGDGSNYSSRNYATEMDLSALGLSESKKVKMIGATSNTSYFILTTNGELWGVGENSAKELGIGNSSDQNNWQRVQLQTGGVYDEIVWISPNEHSAGDSGSSGYGASNALTNTGKLWAWGRNSSNMLGESRSNLDPTAQPGNLGTDDRLIAVETGGHTTMVIRQCSKKYGYVGHKINGSMGDGTTGDGRVDTFNFSETAEVTLCGAPTTPTVSQEVLICSATDETDLNDLVISNTPQGFTLEWWTTPNMQEGTQVTDLVVKGIGTYYAFYIPNEGACSEPDSEKVEIKFDDPEVCYPGGFCPTGDCNDNTFLNTSDPNTIEYDNMISGFHSTFVKQDDGNYLIWGQNAAPEGNVHLTEQTALTPANGFHYDGHPLKVALASGRTSSSSDQYALLTTEGLYVWGVMNYLVGENVRNLRSFGKINTITNANSYGLPQGVEPGDVKMMFGTYRALAIVTCYGDAYVLSNYGSRNGDGTASAEGDTEWHRVMINANTPLTGVVALRGQTYSLMALTATGDIYTWGERTYLGDGTEEEERLFATKMTLPTGVTPKMIGMTNTRAGTKRGETIVADTRPAAPRDNEGQVNNEGNTSTYYILGTDGKVYAMGANQLKQLGDFSTVSESLNWVNSKADASTDLTDIVWISPNEHSYASQAVIQVLNENGKMWGWGVNDFRMLGDTPGALSSNSMQFSRLSPVDPIYMPALDDGDHILAVETGGHISTLFKDCSYYLGYIGHEVNGSYASDQIGSSPVYKFDNVKMENLCSIDLPALLHVEDLMVCNDGTADLNDAMPSDFSDPVTWYYDQELTQQIQDITAVEAGTYYVVVVGNENCGVYETVYVATSPLIALDDINQTPSNTTVDGNIIINDSGLGDVSLIDATYRTSNGGAGSLNFDTATEIYDANNTLAGEITLANDGSYTFVPAEDYSGKVAVQYTIEDESCSAVGELVITVIPTEPSKNNPPIAQNDNVAGKKNNLVSGNVLANDSDPDGDNITVIEITVLDSSGNPTTVTVPENGNSVTTDIHDESGTKIGELEINKEGNFTFNPVEGYNGEVPSIPYIIEDDGEPSKSDTANLNITILDIPEDTNTTFAVDDANSGPKGKPMTGNVLDNDHDPEGDNQTLTSITIDGTDYPITAGTPEEINISGKGTLTIGSDGEYEFVPEEDFVGTVVVKQTVCDTPSGDREAIASACDNATLYLTTLPLAKNYWMGGTTDRENDWNEPNNWTANYIPEEYEDIEFATVENYGTAAVDDLYVPEGITKKIGSLINETKTDGNSEEQSLVIPPNSGLYVYEDVIGSNDNPDKIIVQADEEEATGTLWFPNAESEDNEYDYSNVQATVEFYNKGYDCKDCGYFRKSWQYFGIPVASAEFPYNDVTGDETIHKWDEPANGNKWITPSGDLEAFIGYEITNSSDEKPEDVYSFKGTLNVGDKDITLSKTSGVNYEGMNLIANSFTAAIPIDRNAIVYNNALELDNVYLFNTGTRDQWRKLNGGTTPNVLSGTYTSVPIEVSGQAGLPNSIPSMHTFMIQAKSHNATVKLKYDQLVKNEAGDGQPAWRSAQAEKREIPHIVVDVIGSNSADRVWLFEQAGTTRGFDAGWDGVKMPEKDIVQFYVAGESKDENYQVATVPQMVGTSFGLNPVKTIHELSLQIHIAVSSDVEARGLYLRDMLTGRSYALKNGAEYQISASAASDNRFKVVDTMLDESKLGANPLIDIYVVDGQVVVANNSDEECTVTLFNAAGKLVAKKAASRNSTTYINNASRTAGGVYVVKVTGTQEVNEIKRVIVR